MSSSAQVSSKPRAVEGPSPKAPVSSTYVSRVGCDSKQHAEQTATARELKAMPPAPLLHCGAGTVFLSEPYRRYVAERRSRQISRTLATKRYGAAQDAGYDLALAGFPEARTSTTFVGGDSPGQNAPDESMREGESIAAQARLAMSVTATAPKMPLLKEEHRREQAAKWLAAVVAAHYFVAKLKAPEYAAMDALRRLLGPIVRLAHHRRKLRQRRRAAEVVARREMTPVSADTLRGHPFFATLSDAQLEEVIDKLEPGIALGGTFLVGHATVDCDLVILDTGVVNVVAPAPDASPSRNRRDSGKASPRAKSIIQPRRATLKDSPPPGHQIHPHGGRRSISFGGGDPSDTPLNRSTMGRASRHGSLFAVSTMATPMSPLPLSPATPSHVHPHAKGRKHPRASMMKGRFGGGASPRPLYTPDDEDGAATFRGGKGRVAQAREYDHSGVGGGRVSFGLGHAAHVAPAWRRPSGGLVGGLIAERAAHRFKLLFTVRDRHAVVGDFNFASAPRPLFGIRAASPRVLYWRLRLEHYAAVVVAGPAAALRERERKERIADKTGAKDPVGLPKIEPWMRPADPVDVSDDLGHLTVNAASPPLPGSPESQPPHTPRGNVNAKAAAAVVASAVRRRSSIGVVPIPPSALATPRVGGYVAFTETPATPMSDGGVAGASSVASRRRSSAAQVMAAISAPADPRAIHRTPAALEVRRQLLPQLHPATAEVILDSGLAPFLAAWSTADVTALCGRMKPEAVRAGHVFYSAGDKAERCYFVAQGTVRVEPTPGAFDRAHVLSHVATALQQPTALSTLSAPTSSSLGRTSSTTFAFERTSSVTSTTSSRRASANTAAIAQQLSKQLLKLTNSPAMTAAALASLTGDLSGLRQGGVASPNRRKSRAYLLDSAPVDDPLALRFLTPWSAFGFAAVLSAEAHTTTAVAETDAAVWHIDSSALLQFLLGSSTTYQGMQAWLHGARLQRMACRGPMDVAEILHRDPAFAGVKTATLRAVALFCAQPLWVPVQGAIAEATRGDAVLIVTRGSVAVRIGQLPAPAPRTPSRPKAPPATARGVPPALARTMSATMAPGPVTARPSGVDLQARLSVGSNGQRPPKTALPPVPPPSATPTATSAGALGSGAAPVAGSAAFAFGGNAAHLPHCVSAPVSCFSDPVLAADGQLAPLQASIVATTAVEVWCIPGPALLKHIALLEGDAVRARVVAAACDRRDHGTSLPLSSPSAEKISEMSMTMSAWTGDTSMLARHARDIGA